MEVITILAPISTLLALAFVVGFVWMSRKGQYDDLETPAMRMLLDEKVKTNKNKANLDHEGKQ